MPIPSPAELRRIACAAAAACAPALERAFRSTPEDLQVQTKRNAHDLVTPVSYTHLTLPTILLV